MTDRFKIGRKVNYLYKRINLNKYSFDLDS